MITKNTLFAALAVSSAIFAGAVAPAHAGPDVNTTAGLVLADGKPAPGLGVHGYDVVAYQTEGKPVRGKSEFATVHKEATYRFASKANLDTFKANPAKYEPAYGGYCAYGVSVGAKFDGDPNFLPLDIPAPDAPDRLAAFLGRAVPWWGRANANPPEA